ncbi:MAG: YbjN domain-containing protein [Proteobacteria bacterium]|nr:YbjN domain-containing protein [Pseudomonadota bacterium]
MSLIGFDETAPAANPLDVVERIALQHGWSFERTSPEEITLLVSGQWTEYQVSFTWMDNIEALHMACAFELKVPERRRTEVNELVARANEQLWVGHFDLWVNDGLVMYRNAHMLPGGSSVTSAQCDVLLATALESCERYYQAFQFVLWAGKSAREAIDATLFETAGQA